MGRLTIYFSSTTAPLDVVVCLVMQLLQASAEKKERKTNGLSNVMMGELK